MRIDGIRERDESPGLRDFEASFLRLLVELNRMGTTVVIASHDQDLVARSGMPVMHLEQGRLSLQPAAGPRPFPEDVDTFAGTGIL